MKTRCRCCRQDVPLGGPRAASVILNKMFSLPDTRCSSATKSLVTLVSARALIPCTVAMSKSARASVISRWRQNRQAASSVTMISCGWERR